MYPIHLTYILHPIVIVDVVRILNDPANAADVHLQAIMKASARYPCQTSVWDPWTGATLVGFYFDLLDSPVTLPCAKPLSTYWTEFVESGGQLPCPCPQRYCLDANLVPENYTRRPINLTDSRSGYYMEGSQLKSVQVLW